MPRARHVLVLTATFVAWGCNTSDEAPARASNVGAPTLCVDSTSSGSAPMDLECTGLYEDWSTKRIASSNEPFKPGAELWSDGARKARYVHLPNDSKVDASDPDEWTFPVGTKLWKEFSMRERRVETRYFEKVRDDKWVRATYVWSSDGQRARREDNGATVMIDGAAYAVPDTGACDRCHRGKRDLVLGFEAIGLAAPEAEGLTLARLVHEERIEPAPDVEQLRLPDERGAGPALAWLHVNCGTSCHSPSPNAEANATELFLRVEPSALTTATSFTDLAPFATSFRLAAKTPRWSGQLRLVPRDPDGSLLYRLAASRGDEQMPPLSTNVVDETGLRAVRDWIQKMPIANRAAAEMTNSETR